MTPHAQVALVFCQLCLGWKNPVDRAYADQNSDPFGKPSRVWSPYVFDFNGKHDQFHYTDINVVLPTVRGWCDQNDASLELAYYGYVPGEWEAQIATPVSLETIVHADPCQALMAACVEAARKLRAA